MPDAQPCEVCGTRRVYDNDLLRRAKPGIDRHASKGGYTFARICELCVQRRPDEVRAKGWSHPVLGASPTDP